MRILLEGLLPRLYPELPFMCIHHEGKNDLEKSVPKKLRGWNEPGARFVVIRDNDGGNCLVLKHRLAALCSQGGRSDVLIRIACQELEAWYLGEPDALADAFSKESLRNLGGRARYRNPDTVPKPSTAVERLIPEFQKVSGARKMASVMSRDRNRSTSFQVFLAGIDRLLEEITNAR